MLIDLLKINNTSITELAKELDVSVSRIYYWNARGIYQTDRCWNKLHTKFPSLKPKQRPTTSKGKEDKRITNKRPKQKLVLTDTDISSYREESRKSELFPTIHFKSTK